MDNTALTRWQWRIILLGWVTYAAYYLGRVNLAAALPAIQSDLQWFPEQTSTLAGAGLWTYALGQLVNGWLGHYVDTRRMVLIGILGSTLMNLLFATALSLPVMIGLSLANGFFQAMGWGPILRTLSDALAPTQRQRIAGVFGASYVVGNALTWVLAAFLLRSDEWRWTFVILPLLMLTVGLVWYGLSKPAARSSERMRPISRPAVVTLLRQFWHILVAALVAGALFNGALIYAPSYIAQILPLDQAALTAIIFPLFGLLGTVWLSGWVMQRLDGNVLGSLILLLILAGFTRLLAVILPVTTLSAAILLASMGVTSYALTNLVLTAVPLTAYSHLGTSIVAGTMDATHSIGGAIGSSMVGLLLTRGNWQLVFGAWTFLALIAIGILTIAIRQKTIYRIDRKEELL